MPRLNNDERKQAIVMLNGGMLATVVSRHFSCTRKTIKRLWRRFHVTGNFADRPRSGRPRVTTDADDRYIVLQHLRNKRLTPTATGRQNGIHPQTVRNRLRQNVKIRAYRLYFGHILTRRHRTARRDWCRRHLHFRRADWDLILFSNDCQFNLSHADGRERVYRRREESFADACVIERDHFGGGLVLVWGEIMGGNKTRNDVLAVEALPFIYFHGPNVIFMHDNARPHSTQ